MVDVTDQDEIDSLIKKESSERLGYTFSAWNGQGEHGDNIIISAGCGVTTPWMQNLCGVNWLPESAILQDVELACRVVGALVEAFEPDYCEVVGMYNPPVEDGMCVLRKRLVPEVGWLLYLAGRRLSLKEVPSAVEIRPVWGGSLVVVDRTPIDVGRADHREHADRVRQELGLPVPYTIEPLFPG